MKKLFLLLFLLPFAATASPNKQKTEKAAIEAKAFQAICELVNNKHFQIDIDRAYPQSGFDVSLFRPQGKIIVTDSIAKGNLPYFGRAYSLPYGEGGSIEFEGKIKENGETTHCWDRLPSEWTINEAHYGKDWYKTDLMKSGNVKEIYIPKCWHG